MVQSTIHILVFLYFAEVLLGSVESKAFHPSSSTELKDALDSSLPGDLIELKPGTNYQGDFVLPSKNGSIPITIRKEKSISVTEAAVLLGEKNPILIENGTGGVWHLKGFAIKGGEVGINSTGNGHVFDSLFIEETGTGISSKGNNVTINACLIKAETGIYSEGVGVIMKALRVEGKENGILASGDWMMISALSVDAPDDGLIVFSGKGLELSSSSIKGSPAFVLGKDSCCGWIDAVSVKGDSFIHGNGFNASKSSFMGTLNLNGCGNKLEMSSIKETKMNKTCEDKNVLGGSVATSIE